MPALSGYPDSNGGPPGPKPGALTNCATSRLDRKGKQKIRTDKSDGLSKQTRKRNEFIRLRFLACFSGEGGIRTPGTLIGYVSLANWWFQPLTHLTG